MIDWLLNKLGLQRIPEEQRQNAISKDEQMQPWDRRLFKMPHKRRFMYSIFTLVRAVEALNIMSFRIYVINVDGFCFTFNHAVWTDFTIEVPDAWLVRSKLGDHLEYNMLRLDEDDQESWWRLANATEAALNEVKRQDNEKQAEATMNMLIQAD